MSNVAVFDFESAHVRVIHDEGGEPLFVGKDVCGVLGYANHNDTMNKHCKGVAKRYPLSTAGGTQEVRVLTEADVMRLIISSKLPAAVAFERWVFEEVLPSIRKTGAYASPAPATPVRSLSVVESSVAALILLGDRIAKVPGVKPGMAMAATLNAVKAATGLDTSAFRAILPSASHPICSLNATKVGEALGISARAANSRLEAAGLQFRNYRGEWELTESGAAMAEAFPFSTRGHSGYQILWNPEIVEQLK